MGNNNPSKEKESFTRRSALKSAGILTGVSAFSIPVMGEPSDDTTEIVLLRNKYGPVKTTEVSTKALQREMAARNARDTAERRFLQNNENVASVGLRKTNRQIEGYPVTDVIVGVWDLDKANLPDEIEGIPLRVEREEPIEPRACYQNQYQPAKGGVGITTSRPNGYAIGSFCCGVYDGSEPYMLTARHTMEDSDWCEIHDPTGDTVYQYRDAWGNVHDDNIPHDLVIVRPDFDEGVSSEIVSESATINGYVPKHNFWIGKRVDGRFTMSCSYPSNAEIKDYDLSRSLPNFGSGCTLTDLWRLNINHTTGGDSGGLVYHIDSDGYAYVIGMLLGGWNNDFGVAAYAISNDHGYDFVK